MGDGVNRLPVIYTNILHEYITSPDSSIVVVNVLCMILCLDWGRLVDLLMKEQKDIR